MRDYWIRIFRFSDLSHLIRQLPTVHGVHWLANFTKTNILNWVGRTDRRVDKIILQIVENSSAGNDIDKVKGYTIPTLFASSHFIMMAQIHMYMFVYLHIFIFYPCIHNTYMQNIYQFVTVFIEHFYSPLLLRNVLVHILVVHRGVLILNFKYKT